MRQKVRAGTIHRPVIGLLFREESGQNFYTFIVDGGTDTSLAPRQLAGRIGFNWTSGSKITLTGMSPRPECSLEGRIHRVGTIIPELALELSLPVCFPNGNAPYLIGRQEFFDQFRVTFDKTKRRTVFSRKNNVKG